MEWLWRNLPTVQGRLIAGLLLVAAVVFGLWPDHARSFSPERAAPIAVAAITWLFTELAGAGPPREHDIALFRQISGIMNDDALTFLLQHDFHINLHQRFTQPVNEIAEWHGARYDFIDRRLQNRWRGVRAQIDALADLYGATLVTTTGEGMLTARLLGYPPHQQPQQAQDDIRALNEAATTLYTSYNAFDRFARRRLGL